MGNHRGLADDYAKSMEHFGCGVAMFQPVSGGDMCPPCAGYFDTNGSWNPVADICWIDRHGRLRSGNSDGSQVAWRKYEPLEREPLKMEALDIEWRPRASQGVRQSITNIMGETP
jgi:hypothetical protein